MYSVSEEVIKEEQNLCFMSFYITRTSGRSAAISSCALLGSVSICLSATHCD